MLCLEELTNAKGDNWWKELLRLWTPSGCGEGLRLAVRYNTLDFYYKGSVAAHISFSPGKRKVAASPRVVCHVQFIFEGKIPGQKQALFYPQEGLWKRDELSTVRPFDEIIAYIGRWQGSTRTGKAPEKIGVDAIVANSGNVIDLEMGLPAWERKKSALRMDLVSLERDGDRIQIAFWEAKTFDDSRLRRENGAPEVVGQLLGTEQEPGYVDYVNHGSHEADIRKAYAETCLILKRLHEMKCAVTVGNSKPTSLDPLVAEVARLPEDQLQRRLVVRGKPGLVIYGDTNKLIATDTHWPLHRQKILEKGIDIVEQQNSRDIILPVVPRVVPATSGVERT